MDFHALHACGSNPRQTRGYDLLGIHLTHIVNDPENYIQEGATDRVEEKYKCPQCNRIRGCSKRFFHSKDLFPRNGIPLPIRSAQESEEVVKGEVIEKVGDWTEDDAEEEIQKYNTPSCVVRCNTINWNFDPVQCCEEPTSRARKMTL